MNNVRRKTLRKVIKLMAGLKDANNNEGLLDELRQAADDLELVRDEEQDALDNILETMTFSHRADVYTDNIENIDDAWTDTLAVIEAFEESDNNPYEQVKEDVAAIINNLTEAIERR